MRILTGNREAIDLANELGIQVDLLPTGKDLTLCAITFADKEEEKTFRSILIDTNPIAAKELAA